MDRPPVDRLQADHLLADALIAHSARTVRLASQAVEGCDPKGIRSISVTHRVNSVQR